MDTLKLRKKVQKEHGPFADSVEGLSVEDLKKNFSIYAKYRHEAEQGKEERESQEDIKELKERIKFELEPFITSAAAYKLKMKYLALLVKERGGVLTPEMEKKEE